MWPTEKHFRSDFAAGAQPVQGEASIGDHLQAVYHLWLVGHQLEHGRAPWLDPYTFRPESSPRVNFGGWPFGLPLWPLFAAFGAVVAWNLFLLLSYVAAGGFACLWLRELRLPRGAALAGGLAFTLAPYRVAQSAGHFRGPISILLPLALFAFERSRRGSRCVACALGRRARVDPVLRPAPVARSDPVLPPLRGRAGRETCACSRARRWRQRWPWARASSSSACRFRARSARAGARSREVAHYSAEGLDLITRHNRHGPESFIYLGWLTPLLAVAGVVLLVRPGGSGSPWRWPSAPSSRSCSRSGRTSRSTRRSGTTSRRCGFRASRSGRCRWHASRSPASPRSRWPRSRAPSRAGRRSSTCS